MWGFIISSIILTVGEDEILWKIYTVKPHRFFPLQIENVLRNLLQEQENQSFVVWKQVATNLATSKCLKYLNNTFR